MPAPRPSVRATIPLWLLPLLSALAVAGSAGAQTWEAAYDPALGSKPSAQGFTHWVDDPLPDDGLDEGNYSIVGGLLVQGPTGGASDDDANRQAYELASQTIDFDRDVLVIEASVRVIESTLSAPPAPGSRAGFGISLVDRTGTPVVLYIGGSGAFLWGSDVGTSALVSFDATDDLHEYRLRVDPSGASLALDGFEIATLPRSDFGPAGSSLPNNFRIGDLTIRERSSTELERFRIQRFPIPSPEVRSYRVVTEWTASNGISPKTLPVSCPAGTVALTGGVSTSAGPGVGISESYPGPGTPPTSWIGSARELGAPPASWDLRVDVICGEVSGYERTLNAEVQTTDPDPFAILTCPGNKRPFSGGAALAGASLLQTLTASVYDAPLVSGSRWRVAAQDFGAVTSSSAWGLEVHALCSDATRQETHDEQSPLLVEGSPKSLPLNCRGGKVPIGGGAFGGDGGIEWSRPKAGAPGAPPVGWEAQSRGSGAWRIGVRMDCAPIADPTFSANGLSSRFRAEFDTDDAWGWAHATPIGSVGYGPGIDGQAFEFDGASDQWVSVPTHVNDELDYIDFYPQADFTVAAWIRSDGFLPEGSQPQTIVQLYDPGGTHPSANWSTWWMNLQTDGRPRGYLRGPAGPLEAATVVDGPTSLDDGQWHHVALSRHLSESVLRLYVDGSLVDEDPLVVGSNDQPLVPGNPGFGDPVAIGASRLSQSTDVAQLFDGRIDDVGYWDRALTLEEIQNIVGCHRAIANRVLNLDADRFASPAGGEHALCVYLEAGQHDLMLVSPATHPDARFTGWSPAPDWPWGTAFSVEPEIDSGFVFGHPVGESSAQAAFDATAQKQVSFTLSQAQRVRFSLVDATSFDNRGGVSIALPEPGSGRIIALGLVVLAAIGGRRSRKRNRNAPPDAHATTPQTSFSIPRARSHSARKSYGTSSAQSGHFFVASQSSTSPSRAQRRAKRGSFRSSGMPAWKSSDAR